MCLVLWGVCRPAWWSQLNISLCENSVGLDQKTRFLSLVFFPLTESVVRKKKKDIYTQEINKVLKN